MHTQEALRKGSLVVRRVSTQSHAPLVQGGSQATEQGSVMEDNNWLNRDGEVVPAREALGALEDIVDALDAKVDSLDRRIGKAEARLEEIVDEQC